MALKATVWSSSLYGALVGFQRFLKAQCRDWLRNAVNLMTYRYVQKIYSSVVLGSVNHKMYLTVRVT